MSEQLSKADEPVEPFRLKSVRELFEEPEEKTPYIVEGLLPSAGTSLLGGKPKDGKSTLARQLAVAVATGKPFLDRATEKGRVLYFALEEKSSEVKAHFRLLGLTD